MKPGTEVGILALQGGYSRHSDMVSRLGFKPLLARCAGDIEKVRALIIPGGESTVILRLIDRFDMRDAITGAVAGGMAVMGTCAGLIVLSAKADRVLNPPLSLLDIDVRRNSFGSQLESFTANLALGEDRAETFKGVFIRAPVITRTGSGVNVLSSHNGLPVAVECGKILGLTFHPELTGNSYVHEYFLKKVAA